MPNKIRGSSYRNRCPPNNYHITMSSCPSLYTFMIIHTLCFIMLKSQSQFVSYHSSRSWYLGDVQDPKSRAFRICRYFFSSPLTFVCEWNEKPLCLSSHSNTYTHVLPVFVQAALWQSAHSAIYAILCCFPSC